MSRLLKIIFTVSMLLNLLLLGMMAGHAGRFFLSAREHHVLQDLVTVLPAEKRPMAKDIMERADRDTGELRKQLDESRKKAVNLLKAEPFDKGAYLAQVQVLNTLLGRMMQRRAEAVAELAVQCTPADREAIADMLGRLPRPPSHN